MKAGYGARQMVRKLRKACRARETAIARSSSRKQDLEKESAEIEEQVARRDREDCVTG